MVGLKVKSSCEKADLRYHRVDLEQARSNEPQAGRAEQKATRKAAKRRDIIGQVAKWFVPEVNPGGAVYGIITIGALLAAESGARETYPETVGSAVIAMMLYWLAHSYSDVLGLRLSDEQQIEGQRLWQTFVRDWAIVKGASVPLLTLLVAWVTGAGQATAVTAGVWAAVVSLIAFEVAAGVRSKAKLAELVLEGLVGATMGIAILALRALLH
jgi:hypothetical protein